MRGSLAATPCNPHSGDIPRFRAYVRFVGYRAPRDIDHRCDELAYQRVSLLHSLSSKHSLSS